MNTTDFDTLINALRDHLTNIAPASAFGEGFGVTPRLEDWMYDHATLNEVVKLHRTATWATDVLTSAIEQDGELTFEDGEIVPLGKQHAARLSNLASALIVCLDERTAN